MQFSMTPATFSWMLRITARQMFRCHTAINREAQLRPEVDRSSPIIMLQGKKTLHFPSDQVLANTRRAQAETGAHTFKREQAPGILAEKPGTLGFQDVILPRQVPAITEQRIF